MINLAKHFPDLFTHSLSPIVTNVINATVTNEGNGEGQQEKQHSEDVGSTIDIMAAKSPSENPMKTQKKKRKRATLGAVSSKAMGEGDLHMDESIADPANWPGLCLVANSQLRLFISRCDPFVEVAVDADR